MHKYIMLGRPLKTLQPEQVFPIKYLLFDYFITTRSYSYRQVCVFWNISPLVMGNKSILILITLKSGYSFLCLLFLCVP